MSKTKAPPVLREGVPYAGWLHDLSAWEIITDTDPEKQALQVYLYGLEGRYKDLISKIPVEKLKKAGGIKVITDKLGPFCAEDVARQQFECFEKLMTYRRKYNLPVNEGLLEFDSIVSDMQNLQMELPGAVMACLVLKAMNLPDNSDKLARTVSQFDYESMVKNIKFLGQDITGGKQGSDEVSLTGGSVKTEPDDVYYTRGASNQSWRGRGTYGRGRGRFNKQYNTKTEGTVRKCYNCGLPGHLSYNCPTPKKEGGTTGDRKCGDPNHMA